MRTLSQIAWTVLCFAFGLFVGELATSHQTVQAEPATEYVTDLGVCRMALREARYLPPHP